MTGRPRPRLRGSIVHLRDDLTPTMAVCGAGYVWASTILLTDEHEDVTCLRCRAKMRPIER